MKSEKNQLMFIGIVIGMIAMVILMFLIIGGEFNFLFIHFSADGVFGQALWVIPVLLIALQQLYVIPTYVKSYYQIFSETPATVNEMYIPVLNENVILQNDTLEKVTYALWAIVAGLILLQITPILGFVASATFIVDASFYLTLLTIGCFLLISIIRGACYLARRRDVYDLHNKYLGIRGTSPFYWIYKALYFVPLGRSITLLADIQVLDKLTKFNDVAKMKTELIEEDI